MLALVRAARGLRAARPAAVQAPFVAGFSTDDATEEASKPALTQREKETYAKARRSHREELSALRKEWAAEQKQRLQADTAAADAARHALEEERKALRAKFEAEKKARAVVTAAAAAESRRKRAAIKLHRQQQQLMREDVLAFASEERRKVLLAESCNWITEETLEARIAEALDTPAALPGAVAAAHE